MKHFKKLFSVLLILAFMLCLSGCSVITITKAAKNMSSLKSLIADISLDLSMDMSMMDEAVPVELSVSGPIDMDLANSKKPGPEPRAQSPTRRKRAPPI